MHTLLFDHLSCVLVFSPFKMDHGTAPARPPSYVGQVDSMEQCKQQSSMPMAAACIKIVLQIHVHIANWDSNHVVRNEHLSESFQEGAYEGTLSTS